MDMLAVLALICVFYSVQTEATNIQFVNSCDHDITLVKTENGRNSVLECDLSPGSSCSRSYYSNGMNFKHGWSGQVTLAEFSFNSYSSLDFYDLSVITGYNVPMQIRPSGSGSVTVTCNGSQCPDAYLYPSDNTKTHATRTGGTFTVTFCP